MGETASEGGVTPSGAHETYPCRKVDSEDVRKEGGNTPPQDSTLGHGIFLSRTLYRTLYRTTKDMGI